MSKPRVTVDGSNGIVRIDNGDGCVSEMRPDKIVLTNGATRLTVTKYGIAVEHL